MLPNLDDISPKLAGTDCDKSISKLDGSNGFYQFLFDTWSSKLTTFITPFGS